MLTAEQKGRFKNLMEYINLEISKYIYRDDLKHVYVAGGAIASALSNTSVRDYDIYFETRELAEKYHKILINNKTEIFECSLKIGKFSITNPETGLSFITKIYGAPSEMIETFDFVHCRCYSYLNDKEPTLDDEVLNLINRKVLEIYNPQSHHRTLMRAIKFIHRGWNISADEWENICTNSGFGDITTLAEDLNDFLS